MDFLVGISDR